MSKPNKDGWIRHHGGKCPVEAGVLVDVKHRDGQEFIGIEAMKYPARQENWLHDTDHKARGEIMAYRLHKPADQRVIEPAVLANVQAFNEIDSLTLNHQWAGRIERKNPLQWRDRITEIDASVEALEEERASLMQRLEAEGFRLIERVVQPVEGMSDWRNWKSGDQVKVILNNDCPGLWIGRVVTIRSVEPADYDGSMPVSVFYDGDWNFPEADDGSGSCVFQFHSRPSK